MRMDPTIPFACADYVKVHLMIYYLQCKIGQGLD